MNIRMNDLAGNKEQQRQRWDSVAVGWKKWWPSIESGARNVSERMVELAEIETGQRVLDIATGIGEPALLVASRVGPAGFVVATDLSSRMLAIAEDRAMALGLTNVKFMMADAERLDFHEGSFDAILWRWGPADLPDPSNALAAIRRMLTPKGSFVASAWEAGPSARPLANLAMMVGQELFHMPVDVEPPCPPEDGLGKQMTCAGFLGCPRRRNNTDPVVCLDRRLHFISFGRFAGLCGVAFWQRAKSAGRVSTQARRKAPAIYDNRWQRSDTECNSVCCGPKMTACVVIPEPAPVSYT